MEITTLWKYNMFRFLQRRISADQKKGEEGRMLTYSFEDMDHESLYEYLYKCIRRDILNGRIGAGEKLPSKRSFAKNLGVSTITVENAYAQLQAEGYIYSVPKSGYYAAKIRQHLLTPSEKSKEADGGVLADPPERSCEEYAVDLVNSRVNPRQFPFTIWARLLREVLSEKKEALMTKAPGAGVHQLRQAIADYLLEYQGMKVRAAQIIIGAGTEYLYSMIIQLLGQDKVYALEDPGYVKAAEIYRSYGVKTAYVPMDEWGVSVDELYKKQADIVHISPSHHYPTGITTPIGRRYELLAWADEKEERYIIEDDYDCEFRLAGRPIPSLQSIDGRGKVIYMNTFTKSLTPTIRISYMVLPEKLMQRFEEKLGFYACKVSNFEQYTLAEFIARGYFEKHINRMRNYYRGKRDELLSAIREKMPADKVLVSDADAGLHFLMEVQTDLPDEELVRRAAGQGIRISCLSQYYHEAPGKMHKVVVNYSGLEKEQTEQLITGLCRAWFENL